MKLADYYDIISHDDLALLTCKTCGLKSVIRQSDRAAYARALNHGVKHGGIQNELPLAPRPKK